jgi:hypothetical protein
MSKGDKVFAAVIISVLVVMLSYAAWSIYTENQERAARRTRMQEQCFQLTVAAETVELRKAVAALCADAHALAQDCH